MEEDTHEDEEIPHSSQEELVSLGQTEEVGQPHRVGRICLVINRRVPLEVRDVSKKVSLASIK